MYPYTDLVRAVLQPRYVGGISRDPKRDGGWSNLAIQAGLSTGQLRRAFTNKQTCRPKCSSARRPEVRGGPSVHSGALTILPQQAPGKQQREDGMHGDGWPQKRTAPSTTHSHIREVQRNEQGIGQHSD